MDRCEIVDRAFRAALAAGDLPDGSAGMDLGPVDLVMVFRAQCLSRHLDFTARELQRRGQGYYTIGSSGHEGMAAVAAALRPDDMAFLHYRDAAFQIMRAYQTGADPCWDMLLSFAASSEDPISGGRHKVLGSKALMIPPQTSTIASHLPKAVGAAYSLGLARRRSPEGRVLAEDGVVVCSFGDASANHSTAQGAFNTAAWTCYQSVPLPLLFVCEDNGLGISVRTPEGWIAANFAARPGLKYYAADGLNIAETARVAAEAAEYVRQMRRPAFLHLRTVRLFGHAGSDVETTYRSLAEIEAAEAEDPLLRSAGLLRSLGLVTPEEALALYDEAAAKCRDMADRVVSRPRLASGAEVAASLVPPKRDVPRANRPSPEARAETFGRDLEAMATPQPMAKLINWALTDLMLEVPEIVLTGEDVGRKGGVYGVTQRLQARFGADRVFDTLLDEQSILGLAIGLAHNGFLAVPEIQFLAYLHNAEDQIRGEAATLSFFSNGQFVNPMVVRIAGLGYQRGFGGHFHNDNSLGVLRDIPGVVVACPSDGAEAAGMLRECVRLAREEGRVVVFVEPIALYQTRDLEEGDGAWLRTYPAPDLRVPFGAVGVAGEGTDLAIVSYANGYRLARQVAGALEGVRTVDLRWIAPLPEEALLEAVAGCRAVLVVDECRRSGNVSEGLMTLFAENGVRAARVTADDCFIATGPAYAATLPNRQGILAAARALLDGN